MKIHQAHFNEWTIHSLVHQEIVQLNVQSINKVEGYSPSSLLFDLLHPNPKRNNSGRLEAAALRQFNNCLETSGWWVSGIDPHTWDDMEWGRFKPDPDTLLAQPHFNKKTGQWEKAAKYRSPSGVTSRLVFLKVPDSIWHRVSDRYNVPITEAEKQHPGGFWHWVLQHEELPIIFVEGEKKAGCLVTLGYIAIPLPGIWMGRRYADPILKLGEKLIPEIELFVQPGRPTVILFDNDPKLKTKKQVFKATVNLAKLLDKEGCTVNVATLPSIEGEKNAVDDFIVSGGDIAPILSSAVDWKIYKNNSHPSNWKQPSTEEREKARRENYLSQLKAKLKTWWKQQRKFTPTITQNQKYSEFPRIEDGCIFESKGGTGTGKTYQMEQLFKPPVVDKKAGIYEEGGQFNHDGAVMIGSRNSLQLQNANRLGFYHLQRDKCFHILHDPKSKIALCSNSLLHFLDPKWFDGKVLVLDEIMELLQHLLHSKTHKNHAQCLKLWSECLRRAKTIILLDANLADWAVDEYIINLAGRRKVIKLENKFKGDRAPVEFIIGTPTKKSKLPENIEKGLKEKGLNSRDISPYISSIMAGKIPIIFTDSQKQAEAIDWILTNVCGKKGLRIDSKTIAEKGSDADKFMSDPNNVIKTLLPQFVVCSPSVQSGVDINITDYFTDSYGLFFGVVGTNTQLQMMGRLRDPNVKWHIACPEYTRKNNESFGSSSTKKIIEALKEYLLQDTAIITKDLPQLFDLIKSMVENLKDDPHHNAWAKLKAIENYEKANLRDCLIEVLTEAGHEIKFVELQHDDDGAELLKEAKETVLRKESSEIFNAPDIDPDKVQELQASFDATWEDRCKIIRAGYLDRLPGIENSKFWNEELIYLFRKHRDFISQSELYYFLYNPEHLQEQQQELWAYIALGGMKFLPDIRSRHLKIKALEKLGIKEILESGKSYSNKSPEILKMLETARRSKKMSAALGIVPGVDGIKYLKRVLGLVGHGLVGKKSNGTWSYQVVQDMGEIRDSLAQCLEQKYNPIFSAQEQKSSKWEEVKSVFSVQKINLSVERPQTLTTAELGDREDRPNILLNQGQSSLEKIATLPEASIAKVATEINVQPIDNTPEPELISKHPSELKIKDCIDALVNGVLKRCDIVSIDPIKQVFEVFVGYPRKRASVGFKDVIRFLDYTGGRITSVPVAV